MFKLTRFFTVLLIMLLIANGCSQSAKSILPNQAPLDEASQKKADKLDKLFQNMTDNGKFSGAAIVFQDGKILLNKGYGYTDRDKKVSNSIDTRFRLDHATMPFTSLAIWMLYDQGKLDIEDAVCEYIDECPDTWKELTILDLLNNTSRIPDYTGYADFINIQVKPFSLGELVNQIKNLSMIYSLSPVNTIGDSNYILLAAILEKISGKEYETFIQENILNPLDLKNTGLIHGTGGEDQVALQYLGAGGNPSKPLSHLYSAGGMYSTIEDSYLFLEAIINRNFLNSPKMQELTGEQNLLTWWTTNSEAKAQGYTQASGWLSFDFNHGTVYTNVASFNNQEGSVFAYRPKNNSGFIILVNQYSSPFLWGTDIIPILDSP